MNYEEAVEAMHIPHRPKQRQGLTEVRAALAVLDNPQNKIPAIHIAGTNGKGSIASMTAAVLAAAGYRVGVFTSPSLYQFNERIRINDELISDQDLIALSNDMRAVLVPAGIALSEFEWYTVLAFLYFERMAVDGMVIEVGLGGLLDATNVIAHPLVDVIAHIGMDHMQVLGNTIEAIAEQKAGIIQPNTPVVCYPQKTVVETIIEQKTRDVGGRFIRPNPEQLVIKTQSAHKQTFDYGTLTDLTLPLVGDHQLINAITALETIQAVAERTRRPISAQTIHDGLTSVHWPGRFEELATEPLIICDGAHNPQGIAALAKTLVQFYSERRIIGVTATMRDKAIDQMVPTIDPYIDEYITLSVQGMARSFSADELKAKIAAYSDKAITALDGSAEAGLQLALEKAGPNDLILCYGSLYLVSDFRYAVTEAKAAGTII